MQLFTEKILVIDYGSANIKGALVEMSPTGRRILRLESLPAVHLRDEEGGSGEDRDQAGEYEYNLVRYVQSFFPEELNFVLVLPNSRVYVRDIAVPASNLKQIAEVIPYEVESVAPISLDEAEVIGQPWEIEEESAKVISFTATHENLEQAVQPLLRGNASIRMLTVDAAALAGFLQFLDPEGFAGLGVGQLDIGGSATIFNIVQNGKLCFTRQLPFGGADITRLIADKLNIDLIAAEERKLQLELDLLYDERRVDRPDAFFRRHRIDRRQYSSLVKAVSAAFQELAEEIRRSLLAAPGGEVRAIYLSGGGSLIHGLGPFLEDLLAVNVRGYPLELSDGANPALWATTLGAAEHYALKAPDRFDFLRGPYGAGLRGGKFNLMFFSTPILFLVGAAILFLIGLGAGIFKDTQLIRQYSKQVAVVGREIPGLTLRENAPVNQYVEAARKICQSRLQAVRGKSGAPRVVDFLKSITESMPDRSAIDFRVYGVQYDTKSAEITGEVADLGQRQALADAFKRSAMFSEVKVEGQQLPNRRWRVIVRLTFNRSEANASGTCS